MISQAAGGLIRQNVGNETQYDFIDLRYADAENLMNITYGSDKGAHSGHYRIELSSWMRNYTSVTDNQGVFNVTLYEQ